jgi:hypothetical protein
MKIRLPVARAYRTYLIKVQIGKRILLICVIVALYLLIGASISSALFVGGLGVILARCLMLVVDLINRQGHWDYTIDQFGLGLVVVNSVSVLPHYWIRWCRDAPITVEFAGWRGLPALCIRNKTGREVTIVYEQHDQGHVLSIVLPQLDEHSFKEICSNRESSHPHI